MVVEWLTSLPDRFTPGKEPWYPLNRRLGGPQRRSGRVWRWENILRPPGIKPRIIKPAGSSLCRLRELWNVQQMCHNRQDEVCHEYTINGYETSLTHIQLMAYYYVYAQNFQVASLLQVYPPQPHMYPHVFRPIPNTCLASLIHFYLTILIVLYMGYILWSSSLCSLLQSATSSLLVPSIFLSTPLSDTLSLFSPECSGYFVTIPTRSRPALQLPTAKQIR